MEPRVSLIPVRLPNGVEIQVEVRQPVEGDVGVFEALPEALTVDLLRDTISGLAELVHGAIEKARPQKVSVEFGLELGYEPGKLTAFLVNGSAKGNLKIALEWTPSA